MTCVNMFRSTMSNLVDSMTKNNLDTNIIIHDMNLTIMISFMLCYMSWTSLIDLKTLSIHLINEYQYNKDTLNSNIRYTISAKGKLPLEYFSNKLTLQKTNF